jgi:cytochrome c oxidase assembly protein subunit 15
VTSPPAHNRPLHRLALLTAIATFPLIFMGGLVTSHDVGLSVPDWPNSYGYNMFLFPPNQWVGGILYEHTHRLMGTVVGFCAILVTLNAWGVARSETARTRLIGGTVFALLAAAILASLLFRNGSKLDSRQAQAFVSLLGMAAVFFFASFARTPEPRRWVRWLATAVLGMVIFQGVLGGLRVVLLKLNLAIVHACIAQAFFCLATLLAVVSSKWWTTADRNPDAPHGKSLLRLAIAAWTIIYLQLIVGATMRHYKAGLAIPDLPFAFGRVIPPTNDADLRAAQARVAPEGHWWEVDDATLGQVWLAFAHRIGAILVSAAVIALAVTALRKHRNKGLTTLAWLLVALLATQVTLGVLTVLLKKPADIASLHVAIGALVLVTTFVLAARAMRLYAALPTATPTGFDVIRNPNQPQYTPFTGARASATLS